jgi:hypothetical protein
VATAISKLVQGREERFSTYAFAALRVQPGARTEQHEQAGKAGHRDAEVLPGPCRTPTTSVGRLGAHLDTWRPTGRRTPRTRLDRGCVNAHEP